MGGSRGSSFRLQSVAYHQPSKDSEKREGMPFLLIEYKIVEFNVPWDSETEEIYILHYGTDDPDVEYEQTWYLQLS